MGGDKMNVYIVAEECEDGSCILANGLNSVKLKKRTIIEKMNKGEVVILNKELVGKTKWKDKEYNGPKDEQSLYDFYLGNLLNFDNSSLDILYLLLNKSLELYKRPVGLKKTDDFFEHIIVILDNFFNYMGRVDFVFKDKVYKDSLEMGNINQFYLDVEDIVNTHLANYKSSVILKEWESNSTNLLAYRNFLQVLTDLYTKKSISIDANKFNLGLNILRSFFDNISFTFIGGYLYIEYLKALKNAIIDNVEGYKSVNIIEKDFFSNKPSDKLSNKDRLKLLNHSISILNNQLYKYEGELNKVSKKYDALVKKHQDDLLSLFAINKDNKVDTEDKEKAYKLYLLTSAKKVNTLTEEFVSFIKKHTIKKDLAQISNLLNTSQKFAYSNNLDEIAGVLGKGKATIAVIAFVENERKKISQKCLNPKSIDFLTTFNQMDKVEIDILSYYIDMRRYQMYKIEKENKIFKPKERWYPIYSTKRLRPLIVMTCLCDENKFYWGSYGVKLSKPSQDIFEVSWLATYYFMSHFAKECSLLWVDYDDLYLKVIFDFIKNIYWKDDKDLCELEYGDVFKELKGYLNNEIHNSNGDMYLEYICNLSTWHWRVKGYTTVNILDVIV